MNLTNHPTGASDMGRTRSVLTHTMIALALLSGTAGAQSPSIHYTLSMPEPSHHLFHVELRVDSLPAGGMDVALPAWRTGRYALFDFAGGVQEFSARTISGSPLRWDKTDKSTWHIAAPGGGGVVVRYKVYANEFDQRTRGLDDEHGFLDGASVFMYLPAQRTRAVRLTVVPPAGWHVTTGLDSLPGSGTEFSAPGYDYLVDCPLVIGTQRDYPFEAEGKPHLLSLSGPVGCQPDSLIALLRRIIGMNRAYWGDLPYARYVFLLDAIPGAGGATEHINSSVYSVGPRENRRPLPCRGMAGIFSHEFFHTWNVKQFRPRGMDPYDWSRENYYREIWIAEGSTSYMDGLLLARGGLTPLSSYLDGIASMVQNDRQRPGNAVQSLSECSFDLWIKSSRGLQQSYNAETDVYGKGAAVSLLLDLEIRHRSGNRRSFDDLMRAMYRRFPLGRGGYTIDDVQRIAGELAGVSMQDWFDAYVHGREPLPWERALGYAGLTLTPRDSLTPVWLGVQTYERNGNAVAWGVTAGSPAYNAGLSVGDEILALDGVRVPASQLSSRIGDLQPGDTVRLTVFRRNRLREFPVRLERQPVPAYVVEQAPKSSSEQEALRSSWLAGAR